jgi:hypothetical protein
VVTLYQHREHHDGDSSDIYRTKDTWEQLRMVQNQKTEHQEQQTPHSTKEDPKTTEKTKKQTETKEVT